MGEGRSALVSGGTGLVGGMLLEELLARPAWSVIHAVGRRAPSVTDPRVQPHLVDFAALSEQTPLPRAEVAFCCLGTTRSKAGSAEAFRAVDFDAVVAFAKAAKAGGTERFILVSAHGASTSSLVFYNRVKGEAEDALRALGFARLGIAHPSLLLGDRSEKRAGERAAIVVSRALAPLLSPFASRPIEARTVAKALLAIADREDPGTTIYSNRELHALGAA